MKKLAIQKIKLGSITIVKDPYRVLVRRGAKQRRILSDMHTRDKSVYKTSMLFDIDHDRKLLLTSYDVFINPVNDHKHVQIKLNPTISPKAIKDICLSKHCKTLTKTLIYAMLDDKFYGKAVETSFVDEVLYKQIYEAFATKFKADKNFSLKARYLHKYAEFDNTTYIKLSDDKQYDLVDLLDNVKHELRIQKFASKTFLKELLQTLHKYVKHNRPFKRKPFRWFFRKRKVTKYTWQHLKNLWQYLIDNGIYAKGGRQFMFGALLQFAFRYIEHDKAKLIENFDRIARELNVHKIDEEYRQRCSWYDSILKDSYTPQSVTGLYTLSNVAVLKPVLNLEP